MTKPTATTTTTTTMLSTCGGFVTRRNSQIQARNEHSSNAGDSQVSCSSSHLLPQSTDTTTTTTTVACPRLGAQQQSYSLMPSTGNYWVLTAVLIILTASYLPRTTALPRRALGRHLILPHHHHVHLRSAGQEHPHPHQHPHQQQHQHLHQHPHPHHHPHGEHHTQQPHLPSEKSLNCTQIMNVTKDAIDYALQTSYATSRAIEEILMDYLKKEKKLMSLEQAKEQYKLHQLQLDYSYEEAGDSENEENQENSKSLRMILHSLTQLQRLLIHVNGTLPRTLYDKYFKYILEKLEHNKSIAESMLGEENCQLADPDSPLPIYNGDHPLPEYAIVVELIDRIQINCSKYEQMTPQS